MCLCSPSSINWYRRKLGAKQGLHATHWPGVHGLAASAGVWLRATETEISAALRATGPQEGVRTLATPEWLEQRKSLTDFTPHTRRGIHTSTYR